MHVSISSTNFIQAMQPHPAPSSSPSPTPGFVVLKYGGTSVSTSETWKAIYQRSLEIAEREGCDVWITVSAVSQVTNKLIACLSFDAEESKAAYDWVLERHRRLEKELGFAGTKEFDEVFALLKDLERILEGVRLTGEATPRLRAKVQAMGELCSSLAGRAYLNRAYAERAARVSVCRVDARKLLFASTRPIEHEETKFLEADVMPHTDVQACEAEIAKESGLQNDGTKRRVVITQGFIASTNVNGTWHTCLLGRGGSDTSGALFAALLGAKRCEIWTDVYGLFTCDPRLVPEARLIREMSYREAQELAAMGAKVLHPRCLGPAQWAHVPVEVRNTMDPIGSGKGILTRVCSNPDEGAARGKPRVVAVTKRSDQILLTVQNFDMWGQTGFLSRVFTPFGQMGIGVDLIATSEYSVSMTLDNVPGGARGQILARLVDELKALVPRGTVTVEDRCAVVSIVGRRLRHALPNLARAFRCMKGYDVRMVTESAEDLNLSFVVSDPGAVPGYVDALVAKLHRALFAPGGSNGDAAMYDQEDDDVEDESLGASWDELRAKYGETPMAVARAAGGSAAATAVAQLSPRNGDDTAGPTKKIRLSGEPSSGVRGEMFSHASEPVFVVDDEVLNSKLNVFRKQGSAAHTHLKCRVTEIPDKRVAAALAARGFGFVCETVCQVLEFSTFGTTIAFVPRHAASILEYTQAIKLGCAQIVLDDVDIEFGAVQGVEILPHGSPALESFGAEVFASAVGLACVISRLGSVVRVFHGPSPAQIKALGLRGGGGANLRVGDTVIFIAQHDDVGAWWNKLV